MVGFFPGPNDGAKRADIPEDGGRGHKVREDAPSALGLSREVLCNLDPKTQTGDIEVMLVVDLADVDLLGVSQGNDQAGLRKIGGDVQGSSEIVGGAQRQNPEGKAGLDERIGG